jgi:hypothetical protein
MATFGDLCCIRCLVLGDLTQVSLLPMAAFADMLAMRANSHDRSMAAPRVWM